MRKKRKKVVLTVTGSPSDNPYTREGEAVLARALDNGLIENLDFGGRSVVGLGKLSVGHYGLSCHRNPEELSKFLDAIVEIARQHLDTDFVLVMGAGWAAALPGVAAGYLYRKLRAVNVFVLGVGFDDVPKDGDPVSPPSSLPLTQDTSVEEIAGALSPRQLHGLAALLSITQLPGGGRVTCRDEEGDFFGANGFVRACRFAIDWEIPDELRKPPEPLLEKKRPLQRHWVAA